MKFLTTLLIFILGSQIVFSQDKLPSLELFDIDGNKINVATYGENGKITVFNFWATWCTPCKKELNNIADLYEDWQADYNVEIIAVSIDDSKTTANVKSYVNGQSWDYSVLLDVNKDLHRMLNGQTVPFTVIVDQNGVIIEKRSGYIEGDEYILEDMLKELSEKSNK
ncbi:MAG: TlpA family protein disulfide reductase [Bacteroidetes bacterium]|nr:TlpA family protein disulfide reductase [Bacteroidota bacterium]MBP7397957.1 TlpA family protein disulfide reductase [Chitinophagales bacterium]MBK7108915.1 TlpA family protein disulfide reductase [Bacteroidota bacterium]MBK8488759.1 TlpA family protein disulfide reductase [Bacteroidota bacterium]MBK8681484.1 TlpA family protein disulfide reductase [Bacteroidota bacterium]